MDSVAMRYATGLFELAKEENAVTKYGEDLSLVADVFKDQDVFGFFNHYNVNRDTKMNLLDQAFKSEVSEYVLNFLKLLIDKGRIGQCKDIILAYQKLTNDYLGIKEGILYTAKPLSASEVEEIVNAVSKSMDCKVVLKTIIDESLIGGVKVVVGNHVIDGSIKNKLSLLKNELLRK